VEWRGDASIGALLPPPRAGWDRGFWASWSPGEAGARTALQSFLARRRVSDARDLARREPEPPAIAAPALRRISVHRVLAAIARRLRPGEARAAFLRQLGWREFAYSPAAPLPAYRRTQPRPALRRLRLGAVRCSTFDAWSPADRHPHRRRGHAPAPGTPAGCTTACACWSRVS
jgi:deoxyribodipyrimidine photo-lyase